MSANILGARLNERMRQTPPRYALPPGVPYFFVWSANDVRFPQDSNNVVVPERIAAALSAVVVMVLIIATINITGLLLARGISRANELATRRALGVTPGRLARQLLTESVLLASCGGVLGLVRPSHGLRARAVKYARRSHLESRRWLICKRAYSGPRSSFAWCLLVSAYSAAP